MKETSHPWKAQHTMNSKDKLGNENSSTVVGHVGVQPRCSVPHAECTLSQQPGCVTQMEDRKYR